MPKIYGIAMPNVGESMVRLFICLLDPSVYSQLVITIYIQPFCLAAVTIARKSLWGIKVAN